MGAQMATNVESVEVNMDGDSLDVACGKTSKLRDCDAALEEKMDEIDELKDRVKELKREVESLEDIVEQIHKLSRL